MTSLFKLGLFISIAFVTATGKAESACTDVQKGNATIEDLGDQGDDQPFSEFFARLHQPPGQGNQCNGSWDCKWPTTNCENGWCVKPGGGGGECNGSWDCKWPTTSCENGWCVKPGGGGGQCNGSWDCKWPTTSCENGYCVRP